MGNSSRILLSVSEAPPVIVYRRLFIAIDLGNNLVKFQFVLIGKVDTADEKMNEFALLSVLINTIGDHRGNEILPGACHTVKREQKSFLGIFVK